MLDFEAFSGEFVDEFLSGCGLVEFDELRAAAVGGIDLFLFRLRRYIGEGEFAFDWLRSLIVKIQIAVAFVELADLCFAWEVAGPLGIAFADFDHESRELAGRGITFGEVFLKVAAVTPDGIAEFRKALEEFEDVFELGRVENFAVSEIFDLHFVCANSDEDLVELSVVIHIFLPFFALDEVKWGLRDIDFALLHEFRHVTAEEREQEGTNMRTVDVGIGHDDDPAVA